MQLERRHWVWIGAALIATALLAIMVSYDIGGVFSAPGLQQE
jgi:hypothetical protein